MTPEQIIRRGFTVFTIGVIATLLLLRGCHSASIIAVSLASIYLLLSSLAYWRVTGKEIISPGSALVLITFLSGLLLIGIIALAAKLA